MSRPDEGELGRWKQTAEVEALTLIGKTATATDPFHEKFSEEELMLLVAVADAVEIMKHSVDEIIGEWVEAGRQHFLAQSDPAFAALHLDAFESLIGKGLVRDEGGDLYMLTGRRFKIARALKKQMTS